VRSLLANCWFDAERCREGIEALRMYRREWNDKTKEFKGHPLHDWTSHYADAFRFRGGFSGDAGGVSSADQAGYELGGLEGPSNWEDAMAG